jgi:repressor LexA
MAALTLLGRVSAGQPLESIEDPEWVEVPERLAERAQFAPRVRGDSMTEDQIEDGDLILIARQTSAATGEIVVALIDNEAATLKRFYREGSAVRLQPANAAMAPLQFPAAAVQIIGVVAGVLRGAAQP